MLDRRGCGEAGSSRSGDGEGNSAAATAIDLSLSGFAEDEIGGYLRQLEAREKRERPEAFDLDEALEQATREPRTRSGDLWRLGEHRLLCGDATDPPYNVSLGDHGGQTRARRRRIANDALDPVAWEAFVRAWAATLLARVDGALCVCMSSKELPLLSRVLA